MDELLLTNVNGTPQELSYVNFNGEELEIVDASSRETINNIINGDQTVGHSGMADNLQSSKDQHSTDTFIIRTTGGDASLSDGDAWLEDIRGYHTKIGYIPQTLSYTTSLSTRPQQEVSYTTYISSRGEQGLSYTTSITSYVAQSISYTTSFVAREDDEELPEFIINNNFINSVTTSSGEITFTYNGIEWDPLLSNYDIEQIYGTSLEGDSLIVTWQKEIGNLQFYIDENTFLNAVNENIGQITFTYNGSEWNDNLASYGITTSGNAATNDSITIIWQKQTTTLYFSFDEDTFINAISETTGTTTFVYNGNNWNGNLSTYGITATGTPLENDSITVTWQKSIPSLIINIDENTFINTVTASTGTTTFVYNSNEWNYDLTIYGITTSGVTLEQDSITVSWQKENRGIITQSNPRKFISTGWNLYDNSKGYARVIKYHSEYGFGIGGTYTSLQFSTDAAKTQNVQTITPVEGHFSIPSDGYIHVTGGNATDTYIWMTWSDWTDQANGGVFQPYAEYSIDFSSIMTTNFPYGLCEVENYKDEINFEFGTFIRKIERIAYNTTNLATIKSYDTPYEYDTNYIYYVLSSPLTGSITLEGNYTAYDHGLEMFTNTEEKVLANSIYGNNLKNKLERDVLTISQQTLNTSEQAQVRTNIMAKCLIVTGNCPNTMAGTVATSTQINNSNITNDMVVVNSTINTPSAQVDDWSVDTYNGYLTITGTIDGTTAITLYLAHT